MPEALGAAGLIGVALNSTKVINALKSRVPSFLGRISYSLYLVHSLVLFLIAAVLHGKLLPVMFVAYLTAAILFAWGVFTVVEEPFMKLSRRAGTGIVTLRQEEISEVEAFQ